MKARISLTTILVYWFAIVAGLTLYTVTRADEMDLAGMWIGVVGGTALGQFLAARDIRLWFVCVVLVMFVVLCGPFTPMHNGGVLFWMALVPATICGWLSLSDRGSLLAFWFPVVVWMLTILDRGQGALKMETGSAALLGGLAFTFIAFLYARETRRIGLWRKVSTTPIAPETTPVILKEVPRIKIGLAGWSLAVSAAAFGICAWLAPRLWHVEPLVPDIYATSTPRGPESDRAFGDGAGRPRARCCQDIHINETKRSRVKEYFDIGRGHDDDDHGMREEMEECVVCGPDGLPMDVDRYGRHEGTLGYDGDGLHVATGPYDGEGYGEGYGTGEGYRGEGYGTGGGYRSGEPTGSYTPPSTYTPPTETDPPPTPPSYNEPPSTPPPTPPQYTPPPAPPQYTPPPAEPVAPTPPAPPPAVTPPPPPIAAAPTPAQPAPTVEATTVTTAQRAPNAPPESPPIVYWLIVVLASGLAVQLLFLGMRPVRRALTLRHLRRPFWNARAGEAARHRRCRTGGCDPRTRATRRRDRSGRSLRHG
jgi:hypothetical protein